MWLNPFEDSFIVRYENEKQLDKIVTCDKCSEEFKIKNTNVHETVIESKKQNLWFNVKWFMCEKCKTVYIICIDTKETNVLKREYSSCLKRLKSKKNRKVEKLHKKTDRCRNKLKDALEYNKKVFGETLSQVIQEGLSSI